MGFASSKDQWLQCTRAGVAFLLYLFLLKVLLWKPSKMKLLAHIMLQLGLVFIWSNIFVYAHRINLGTVQFVFMVMLCSFYTLGSRFGILYSLLGILPVVSLIAFQGSANIYVTSAAEELGSPAIEIIVVLNFITIFVAHYLFYRAINSNIQEKQDLNEQLLVSVAEANKLAASKSNFLSTISHELRTPLNSVIGIAELLLADKPDIKQKENLNILQSSALDLLSLINNVLDFNKIDSDKLVLEAVPIHLADFMKTICAGLRIRAKEKNLDFILEIDEQLKNTTIISDPTRLSQLIYNLSSNAIKFTSSGSITVQLDCISKAAGSAEIMFSVKDTGIGIHPDKHEKIFELFTQAESHTTREYGGTGLGLAIVKQVLALFNSHIQLESSLNHGSRFFFTLSFPTAAEAVVTLQAMPKDNIDFSNLKILIAEDNGVNRLIMSKQMERLNLNPVMVENGKLAYEAALADHYDAILLDLHMPVMDGYETTKQIRGLNDPAKSGLYIVAFTASVTEQEKIFDSGFDDYLYKPVNMNDLREKLEKISLRQVSVAESGSY